MTEKVFIEKLRALPGKSIPFEQAILERAQTTDISRLAFSGGLFSQVILWGFLETEKNFNLATHVHKKPVWHEIKLARKLAQEKKLDLIEYHSSAYKEKNSQSPRQHLFLKHREFLKDSIFGLGLPHLMRQPNGEVMAVFPDELMSFLQDGLTEQLFFWDGSLLKSFVNCPNVCEWVRLTKQIPFDDMRHWLYMIWANQFQLKECNFGWLGHENWPDSLDEHLSIKENKMSVVLPWDKLRSMLSNEH